MRQGVNPHVLREDDIRNLLKFIGILRPSLGVL